MKQPTGKKKKKQELTRPTQERPFTIIRPQKLIGHWSFWPLVLLYHTLKKCLEALYSNVQEPIFLLQTFCHRKDELKSIICELIEEKGAVFMKLIIVRQLEYSGRRAFIKLEDILILRNMAGGKTFLEREWGRDSLQESESFITQIVLLGFVFYCQCLIRSCRRKYSRINV